MLLVLLKTVLNFLSTVFQQKNPGFPGVFELLLKNGRVKLTVDKYLVINVFNKKFGSVFILVENCRNCYNSVKRECML